MWSTIMAEEVKIVNDSWGVLAREVFKRGLKNAILLNKSQSLKAVICPWKILEKSLKFVCLKLYEPCTQLWILCSRKLLHNYVLCERWNINLVSFFSSQSLADPNNYHEFCRLLARLKSNYQLGEIVKVEGYSEFIALIAKFTVTSLQVRALATIGY